MHNGSQCHFQGTVLLCRRTKEHANCDRRETGHLTQAHLFSHSFIHLPSGSHNLPPPKVRYKEGVWGFGGGVCPSPLPPGLEGGSDPLMKPAPPRPCRRPLRAGGAAPVSAVRGPQRAASRQRAGAGPVDGVPPGPRRPAARRVRQQRGGGARPPRRPPGGPGGGAAGAGVLGWPPSLLLALSALLQAAQCSTDCHLPRLAPKTLGIWAKPLFWLFWRRGWFHSCMQICLCNQKKCSSQKVRGEANGIVR